MRRLVDRPGVSEIIATIARTRQSTGPARKAAQAGYFYVRRLVIRNVSGYDSA